MKCTSVQQVFQRRSVLVLVCPACMIIVNPRAPDSPPIPSSYLYPYPCVLQSKKMKKKKKEVMSLRDGWVVWWMDGCGEEWIDGQRTYIIYKEGSYFMYSCRISQHKQFYSLGWFPLFRTNGWVGGGRIVWCRCGMYGLSNEGMTAQVDYILSKKQVFVL